MIQTPCFRELYLPLREQAHFHGLRPASEADLCIAMRRTQNTLLPAGRGSELVREDEGSDAPFSMTVLASSRASSLPQIAGEPRHTSAPCCLLIISFSTATSAATPTLRWSRRSGGILWE
ncbi:hypothetical protein BW686_20955 [Pseudomonas syringae]|uniref:Uncharacterized protein n=1 Tax=Pseudomonas syringae TaxID=317 RepID=A0A244EM71_PSESX|nr:hypothetical protein BW686_20955 [Pseudomonas syringae]